MLFHNTNFYNDDRNYSVGLSSVTKLHDDRCRDVLSCTNYILKAIISTLFYKSDVRVLYRPMNLDISGKFLALCKNGASFQRGLGCILGQAKVANFIIASPFISIADRVDAEVVSKAKGCSR